MEHAVTLWLLVLAVLGRTSQIEGKIISGTEQKEDPVLRHLGTQQPLRSVAPSLRESTVLVQPVQIETFLPIPTSGSRSCPPLSSFAPGAGRHSSQATLAWNRAHLPA